jgi:hypothetical protein
MTKRRRFMTAALLVAGVMLAAGAVAASDRFSDVPDSNVFHDDIAWLAQNGVTAGCNPPENSLYCPDDQVTRGQMAAFMRRLATGQVVDAGRAAFADEAALIDGYEPVDFSPRIAGDTFEDVFWTLNNPVITVDSWTFGDTGNREIIAARFQGSILIEAADTVNDETEYHDLRCWISETKLADYDDIATDDLAYPSLWLWTVPDGTPTRTDSVLWIPFSGEVTAIRNPGSTQRFFFQCQALVAGGSDTVTFRFESTNRLGFAGELSFLVQSEFAVATPGTPIDSENLETGAGAE